MGRRGKKPGRKPGKLGATKRNKLRSLKHLIQATGAQIADEEWCLLKSRPPYNVIEVAGSWRARIYANHSANRRTHSPLGLFVRRSDEPSVMALAHRLGPQIVQWATDNLRMCAPPGDVSPDRSSPEEGDGDGDVPERSSAEESEGDRDVPERSSADEGNGEGDVPERSSAEEGDGDGDVPERSSAEESDGDGDVPERSSAEESDGDRGVPERSSAEESAGDSDFPERSPAERSDGDHDVPERSSAEGGGQGCPLSEENLARHADMPAPMMKCAGWLESNGPFPIPLRSHYPPPPLTTPSEDSSTEGPPALMSTPSSAGASKGTSDTPPRKNRLRPMHRPDYRRLQRGSWHFVAR
ncbi:hypothetical protein FOL46_007743 [Perkinsus olseni]|uniref:Uncharacterized protein n=1 Tax=Perkinsus olseni TaxID=32597 RepID=A0A7J6MNL0_PEROL|nr:hypothetical protein FOL46_007743 [Perkinsus olseni]